VNAQDPDPGAVAYQLPRGRQPDPGPVPVTIARSPSKVAMSRLPQHLALPAEAVNFEFDNVALTQVGLVRQTHRDAVRGAGVDHIARS
jgi:hypothetical protein